MTAAPIRLPVNDTGSPWVHSVTCLRNVIGDLGAVNVHVSDGPGMLLLTFLKASSGLTHVTLRTVRALDHINDTESFGRG